MFRVTESLLTWAGIDLVCWRLQLSDSVVVHQQRFMSPETNSSLVTRIERIASFNFHWAESCSSQLTLSDPSASMCRALSANFADHQHPREFSDRAFFVVAQFDELNYKPGVVGDSVQNMTGSSLARRRTRMVSRVVIN